jgi:hypothetical protein
MAVDYIHRLVVLGPPAGVRRFRRRVARSVTRTLGDRTWRERVSLSFESMYATCPELSRVNAKTPGDPYDISVWPTRLIGRQARTRYQLHTRNMIFAPFVRRLSRAFPRLAFCLVTFCMDDSEIAGYAIRDGQWRKWILSAQARARHWQRAREKYDLAGDAVYENDDAEFWAEERMLAEMMDRLETSINGRPPSSKPRIVLWFNRPVERDLDTEREILLIELALEEQKP